MVTGSSSAVDLRDRGPDDSTKCADCRCTHFIRRDLLLLDKAVYHGSASTHKRRSRARDAQRGLCRRGSRLRERVSGLLPRLRPEYPKAATEGEETGAQGRSGEAVSCEAIQHARRAPGGGLGEYRKLAGAWKKLRRPQAQRVREPSAAKVSASEVSTDTSPSNGLTKFQVLQSDQVDFFPATTQPLRFPPSVSGVGSRGLLPRVVPPRPARSCAGYDPHAGQRQWPESAVQSNA